LEFRIIGLVAEKSETRIRRSNASPDSSLALNKNKYNIWQPRRRSVHSVLF